jgi:hypothetical protein
MEENAASAKTMLIAKEDPQAQAAFHTRVCHEHELQSVHKQLD